MHVIAIHSISDPDTFWSRAQETPIPEGITLHTTAPNEDGSKAVCVWEAESVDAVRELVDSTSGDVSQNEFFEVNPENAQGLPA